MKHFWALPAALRVAVVLAAQRQFSVSDDLLAYPQFKVQWLDDYVTDAFADTKLRHGRDGATLSPETSHLERYEPPPILRPDEQDARGTANEGDDEVDYELMMFHKQKYLCSIPRIAAPEQDDAATTINETMLAQQREEEAKELARAGARGWELLSGMQGHCMYYNSGWWSYSFCFDQGVRQFHALAPTRGMPAYPPQEDTGADGYVLGTYEKPKSASLQGREAGLAMTKAKTAPKTPQTGELVAKGDSRYLVQKLEGGTICDLTGRGRRVEIQFHCNPAIGLDRISLIKEVSTCAYLMIIQTPRLCKDVAFMPPQQDVPNEIVCRPVLKQHEVDDYLQEVKSLTEALEEAQSSDKLADLLASSSPFSELADDITLEKVADLLEDSAYKMQIVGDIIVGGHSIVPEDMVLEKSAIVGGGKTTYIDTVASSEGRTLTRAELEKLGYGDPRAVEKLSAELKHMAKGRSWKLDIVETPRGREYRGYVDDEEQEEGLVKEADTGRDGDGETAKEDEQQGSQEELFKEEL